MVLHFIHRCCVMFTSTESESSTDKKLPCRIKDSKDKPNGLNDYMSGKQGNVPFEVQTTKSTKQHKNRKKKHIRWSLEEGKTYDAQQRRRTAALLGMKGCCIGTGSLKEEPYGSKQRDSNFSHSRQTDYTSRAPITDTPRFSCNFIRSNTPDLIKSCPVQSTSSSSFTAESSSSYHRSDDNYELRGNGKTNTVSNVEEDQAASRSYGE